MSATSARLNSTGGRSPRPSISRTFVPERKTRSSAGCGQVLVEAMPPQALHQNECSNISGSIPSETGSISSKISWASYVP